MTAGSIVSGEYPALGEVAGHSVVLHYGDIAGDYAAGLGPKGKIIADLRVFALEDHLLIDSPPRAYAGWQAMVKKYVNPRLAPHDDVSAETRDVGVFGHG